MQQKFSQQQSGPGQPGFYSALLQVQCLGNLAVAQPLNFPQQQGNAVGLGQGLDGLPQELPPFVLLGQLLWGGPPVRDDGQVGVIQGKDTMVFFSLTEQVNGGVDRQPVQPGGKCCLPLKGRQPLPSLEESGLGHFFRVVVAPCFAQGQVVDHLLVALHQAGEGILVSLPGQGHQLPVIHRRLHLSAPA